MSKEPTNKEPTIQDRLRERGSWQSQGLRYSAIKSDQYGKDTRGCDAELDHRAADEIDRLKDILRRFAKIADAYDKAMIDFEWVSDESDDRLLHMVQARDGEPIITLGDCMDAREAVNDAD